MFSICGLSAIIICAAITLVVYGLVIAFPNQKAIISLSGAALVIILGFSDPSGGFLADLKKAFLVDLNWNVLFMYIGTLFLAELFIYSEVPAVAAEAIVDHAPSTGWAIALVCLFTGLLSAFVENVATVLVVAPIAIEISKKVKAPLTPVMILLALNANLQGTATLIGDPPSMIFASAAGYSFMDFFFRDGKISIFFFVEAGALVAFLFCLFMFRAHKEKAPIIHEHKVESWVPTVLLCLLVLGLALSPIFARGFPLAAGLICMLFAALGYVWYRFFRKESRDNVKAIITGLDWESMAFLSGIFIVLGALSASGALTIVAGALVPILKLSPLLAFVAIVLISVLISGFIDNVPCIMLMLPVIASLAGKAGYDPTVLYFGLLIGACLGGNVTPFGASANIVVMGVLKKNGETVSFGRFVKFGLPFTLITTAAAATFAYLVWHP
jgi:Na+/H+ antiporter NhaD/arsenite permease-like protein